MSKHLKFFLGHLIFSFIIATVILSLIFFIWYPIPLATAVDVTHIFSIVLTIDIIIGPLLGWLIYKEGKKNLKFDLTIIIFIQVLALSYGVYSIEQGRPVWIAYNVDRFELIRNNEIIKNNIKYALPQYQQPSWLQPQYVAVEFAKDSKQRNDDMFSEVIERISLAQKPERYIDFIQAKHQIQKRAKNLNELKKYNNEKQVSDLLAKYPQANGFVPLKANAVDMTVLVNKKTGEVVKIVNLRPW